MGDLEDVREKKEEERRGGEKAGEEKDLNVRNELCKSQICKPDSERLVSLLEYCGSKDARAQAKKKWKIIIPALSRDVLFFLQAEFGPRK